MVPKRMNFQKGSNRQFSGSKAVWNFSENPSDMVQPPVPKGRVRVSKYMNFWKGSKRTFTPTSHPSEWPPSLEIMCKHSILSGPRTILHTLDHIHYKKIATVFSENEGWGVWRPFWFFSENSYDLTQPSFPQLLDIDLYYMYFSPFAKQNEAEPRPIFWKSLIGLKQSLKSKDLMPWVRRAFGNVFHLPRSEPFMTVASIPRYLK